MEEVTYELRNEGDWLNPKWAIRRNGRIVKRSKQMGMEATLRQEMYDMANRVAIQLNTPVRVISGASNRVVTPQEAHGRREAIWDICRRALPRPVEPREED